MALSLKIGKICRIVYFRNMNATAEDIEIITAHIALGSDRDELILRNAADKRQQCQNKIWGSSYFEHFVKDAFRTTSQANYRAMTNAARTNFWNGRIKDHVVYELFKQLNPVDIRAVWKDTENGWHNHIMVCMRVAAHAYFTHVMNGDPAINDNDVNKKIMYGIIRGCPQQRLPHRAPLCKIPCRSSRASNQGSMPVAQDADIE
jgi:hypothetical protein